MKNLVFGCFAYLLLLGGISLAVTPEPAAAQDVAAGITTSESGVMDYGRPGYPRVRIYLWGNAQQGVWTVEEGTDLLEYLSVATQGDFRESAENRVRNVVRLYRKGQTTGEPVFKSRVEKIFARQVDYPQLRDGDVLVMETIERRRLFTFRQISRIVGTAASLVSLGFLVFD